MKAIDLFASSGTLGQAGMDHNLTDGGTRRYILVQLPEPLSIENKDQKAAVNYCDKLGKPCNIAELTKERLRRAGNKIRETKPMFAGDLGFRVFKLDSNNINSWDPDGLLGTIRDTTYFWGWLRTGLKIFMLG